MSPSPLPSSSQSGRISAGKGMPPISAPVASEKSDKQEPQPFWKLVLKWGAWWFMLACVLAYAKGGGNAVFIYQNF